MPLRLGQFTVLRADLDKFSIHAHTADRDRVYYVSEDIMKQATSIARPNLCNLGTCLGKFSKTRKFRLHVTSLEWLAKYAKYKVGPLPLVCPCELTRSRLTHGRPCP